MSPAPKKLYQRIAENLADEIAEGRFRVGSRLPAERELADEYKVSRPTIREAMIALELRGIVEARQGSGVYVIDAAKGRNDGPELDVGAFELIEARTLFEGEAAALAATEITADELSHLWALVDQMGREPDQPGKVDVDRAFHLAIAAATGNSLIRSTIENLWDVRERSPLCVHMFARARREGLAPREGEHRSIVDALAARDSRAARDAMRAHLLRVTDDLLEATKLDLFARARANFDAQSARVRSRISA